MTTRHPEEGGIGVGVVYSGALADGLATRPGIVDMISVIPEILWHESSDHPRYRWIPAAVELFDAALASTPTVFHGIGFSLGSGLPGISTRWPRPRHGISRSGTASIWPPSEYLMARTSRSTPALDCPSRWTGRPCAIWSPKSLRP